MFFKWGIWRNILLLIIAGAVLAHSPVHGESRGQLDRWLVELKKQALKEGISPETFDQGLRNFVPIQEIIDLDRKQPELELTLEEYLKIMLTQSRISAGKEMMSSHKELLADIHHEYGVQPQFLIALWGIESQYGSLTGRFPVIRATATLAYEGRRKAFFRKEVLNALRILEEGHVSAEELTGSWAGAMGQFQFMPSTFMNYAADYNGDGRIDIWNDLSDAMASAANYLKKAGWVVGQSWGQEVAFPNEMDRSLIGLKIVKPLKSWMSLGVRGSGNLNLPSGQDFQASVIQPDGSGGRAFLVYKNFRVILDWNRSSLFAISVGLLSDQF